MVTSHKTPDKTPVIIWAVPEFKPLPSGWKLIHNIAYKKYATKNVFQKPNNQVSDPLLRVPLIISYIIVYHKSIFRK